MILIFQWQQIKFFLPAQEEEKASRDAALLDFYICYF